LNTREAETNPVSAPAKLTKKLKKPAKVKKLAKPKSLEAVVSVNDLSPV